MATVATDPRSQANIRRVLGSLRNRIRAYIWVEGLSLAIFWVGVTFWLGVALDYYLPIGLGELMPSLFAFRSLSLPARIAFLSIVGLGLAFILYRWVFRRMMARLADHSMAMLVERQYRSFHDSLVTAVEMQEHPDHARPFSGEMLSHTQHDAESNIQHVRLGAVFNMFPFWRNVILALVMVFSVGVYAVFAGDTLKTATERLYLLKPDANYARRSQIEVLGFDENKQAQGARGDVFVVRVQALRSGDWVAPDTVTLYCRVDGESGEIVRTAKRHVLPANPDREFEEYRYDGDPFGPLHSGISFDVVGGDHRVSGFRVNVVEKPAVVKGVLHYSYPDYLVAIDPVTYGPRSVPLHRGVEAPRGATAHVMLETNKDLMQVVLVDQANNFDTHFISVKKDDASGLPLNKFRISLGELHQPVNLRVHLIDTDGIGSKEFVSDSSRIPPGGFKKGGRRPTIQKDTGYAINVGIINDEPPKVSIELVQVGEAITPDALLPFRGTISDDNLLSGAWLRFHVEDRNRVIPPWAKELFGIDQLYAQRLPLLVGHSTLPPWAIEMWRLDRITAGEALRMPGKPPRDLSFATGEDEQPVKYDLKLATTAEGSTFELRPGTEVTLTIEAADTYDLQGEKNIGASEPRRLQVVSAEQFLALLDRREVELRKRFEETYRLMTEVRVTLGRVKYHGDVSTAADPGDTGADPGDKPALSEQARREAASIRAALASQAAQDSQRAKQEVLGVAQELDDMLVEMKNNRVDRSETRHSKRTVIVTALRAIAPAMFDKLSARITTLEEKLESRPDRRQAADDAIAQADEILIAMDRVLQKMLDEEGYNQLIDLVQAMIEDTDRLIEDTKAEQKNQLKRDLIKGLRD